MPRREHNWKPDIYDLTRDRPVAEPQLDVQDLAEEDVAAPVEAVAESAVAGTEEAVVVETPARPGAPAVRVVRLIAPPPRRENDTLAGLVAGAAVGAALTLLLTPLSGDSLRARLQARVQALGERAGNRAEALAQKLPNNTASGSHLADGEQDH